MKYFLHDTSAFDDEKITELYLKFGYEGLGLFYTCLEKIGKQEKPVKTTVLKAQLKVGKRLEKCWSFMEEIGIICSSNGETFNEQLLNFSETYQIKKEKTREKISEWRKKQALTKNVTSYVPFCNRPKVKESKVKESKVNNKDEKIELEILKNDIKKMCSQVDHVKIFDAFEKWRDYLSVQKGITMAENIYTFQNLKKTLQKIPPKDFEAAVDFSINSNYRQIYKEITSKPLKHLNQAAKIDSDFD